MSQFRPLSETKFINDANLVSYWKLDGNSNDSKGSNNGTDTNVSYVAGKFGNAASLVGTGKITIPYTASLDVTNVTLSAWVNINASNGVDTVIIARRFSSAGTNPFSSYRLAVEKVSSSYYMYGVIGKANGNLSTTPASIASLATGTWIHLAMTYDGSNMRYYINGALDTTVAFAGGIGYGDNQSVTLGANPADSPFYGLSDDTAIFSRALSSAEVNELYQGMTLGEYLPNSNTKLLLHLNGNSTDSSGNGNNGTDTTITYSQANGRFGMGAGFNGSSSYIDCGASTSLNFGTGPQTYAAWIKLASATSYRGIISKRHITPSYGNGLQMLVYNNHYLYADGLGTNGTFTTQSIVCDDGKWHFVCVVADRANSLLRLYVDGTPDGTTALGATSGDDTANLVVGKDYATSPTAWFPGSIDEPIIENIAWTPQQVAKYYANSRGFYATL